MPSGKFILKVTSRLLFINEAKFFRHSDSYSIMIDNKCLPICWIDYDEIKFYIPMHPAVFIACVPFLTADRGQYEKFCSDDNKNNGKNVILIWTESNCVCYLGLTSYVLYDFSWMWLLFKTSLFIVYFKN